MTRATTAGSPECVPVQERIATFDSDGTLWSEQPLYFQFAFALDRVKALASSRPEWAYDRQSHIGRLDKALDEAATRGWTAVDMKQNWKVMYPFQK